MKLLFISLLVVIPFLAQGQLNNQWQNIHKAAMNPGKSPEVAAMERYGTYPVNQYTGVPDISIPLYTVKSGKLEFPVTLSYHLGGIKVDDVATWTGLGWTLKANGSISRTVKGLPDDDALGLLKQVDLRTFPLWGGGSIQSMIPVPYEGFQNIMDSGSNYDNMKLYFQQFMTNYFDGQTDLYNYHAGTLSGSFCYNLGRQLVSAPYSDHMITRDAGNNFRVTSEDGTLYSFKASDAEYCTVLSSFSYKRAISNWQLSEIISADRADTIKFQYGPLTNYPDTKYSFAVSEGHYFDTYGRIQTNNSNKEDRSCGITSEERLLSKIIFRDGSVEFKVATELRKDRRKHKLESITVRNKKNETIRQVAFQYGYFISRSNPVNQLDYRLKLLSVSISGSSTANPQTYSFAYQETPVLPPYCEPSTYAQNFGQDMWGFYNGVTTNSHLVGMIPPTAPSSNVNANRQSSEYHMKACALTRINYPTGGYSVFETEANRDNNSNIVGGLRVTKIRSGNPSNETVQKFTYEDPVFVFLPEPDNYMYKMYCVGPGGLLNTMTASHDRTFYTESPLSALGYFSGSPIVYRKVTRHESESLQPGNKTVTYYDTPVLHSYMVSGGTGYYQIPANQYSFHHQPLDWAMGQILKVEHYKDGLSAPIKKVVYVYDTYTGKQEPTGMMVMDRFLRYFENSINPDYAYAKQEYDYYWVYVATGYQKLVKTIETTYDPPSGTSVSQTTEFKYANINSATKRNMLLTGKTYMGSDNKQIAETYTYPQDYAPLEPYATMVSRNMLNYNIESNVLNNNAFLFKSRTSYSKDWAPVHPDLIAPVLVETQDKSQTSPEIRIRYHKYDKHGNPVCVSYENGPMIIYIWGYKGQYPVAKIETTSKEGSYYTTVINAIGTDMNKLTVPTDDGQVQSVFTRLRSNSSLTGAMITSYTYKPLIGMTSETDPSGRTIFYEYDDFGRLKRAKDEEGKVLQEYDYHYAQ